jgi:hypothetical protein
MSEPLPPIERHVATDRFGKRALRTAHDITAALADDGDGDGEPGLLRRNGPHRSIGGLEALIEQALDDDEQSHRRPRDTGSAPPGPAGD